MARVALSGRRATAQWTAEAWSAAGTAAAGPTAAARATTPTTPGRTAPTAAPQRRPLTRAAPAMAAGGCAAAPCAAGASWMPTPPAATVCPASPGQRAPRTIASQATLRPPPPPRACLRDPGVRLRPPCHAVATVAAGPWEEARTAGTACAREASWGQASPLPPPTHTHTTHTHTPHRTVTPCERPASAPPAPPRYCPSFSPPPPRHPPPLLPQPSRRLRRGRSNLVPESVLRPRRVQPAAGRSPPPAARRADRSLARRC